MTPSLIRQSWQQLRLVLSRSSTAPASSKNLLSTSAVAHNSHWDALFPPMGNRRQPASAEAIWKDNSSKFTSSSFHRPNRDAYTGRSVVVMGGDVAAAASRLDRIVGVSGISREWWTNRRHKPKGEERRKLASTRWRKRFKLEVGKKVELVQQIRRRGA